MKQVLVTGLDLYEHEKRFKYTLFAAIAATAIATFLSVTGTGGGGQQQGSGGGGASPAPQSIFATGGSPAPGAAQPMAVPQAPMGASIAPPGPFTVGGPAAPSPTAGQVLSGSSPTGPAAASSVVPSAPTVKKPKAVESLE